MTDASTLAPSYCRGIQHSASEDLTFLLKLARHSDERAFTLLVRIYEPGLRKTANKILGQAIRSDVDTEDLIQFVHCSLWISLRQGKFEIDSAERLLAVARSILRRRVARIWRTLERRRRLKQEISANVRTESDRTETDEPTRRISAEDQFEHLCKMMTSTERRLIELRVLGYSTAEAAREMGRDPEILRVTLARLRKKLRDSGLLRDSSDPRSGRTFESRA
jgi:RNA polymerase sigma-70 factor (ECF subfamily)